MVETVWNILGKNSDSPEISEFLHSYEENPQVVEDRDRTDWELKKNGLCLLFDKKHESQLRAVFFFSAGRDGYEGFEGKLPYDVVFGESQNNIRERLGKPVSAARSQEIRYPPELPMKLICWDRYESEGRYIHLQYSDSSELLMVTVGLIDD